MKVQVVFSLVCTLLPISYAAMYSKKLKIGFVAEESHLNVLCSTLSVALLSLFREVISSKYNFFIHMYVTPAIVHKQRRIQERYTTLCVMNAIRKNSFFPV